MNNQNDIEREAELKRKQDAHVANASSPALDAEEKAELKRLQDAS